MIALFSEKEIIDAFITKRKWTFAWWFFFILYLATAITLVTINIVQISVNRSRTVYKPFLITMVVFSIVFWCVTIFFRGTKYRLIKKYCLMLDDMEFGVRYHGEGVYLRTETDIKYRDGVYFYTVIVGIAPHRKDEMREEVTEHIIFVEREHSLPPLEPGDVFKFVTHSNRLIAYEIVKNQQNTREEQQGE